MCLDSPSLSLSCLTLHYPCRHCILWTFLSFSLYHVPDNMFVRYLPCHLQLTTTTLLSLPSSHHSQSTSQIFTSKFSNPPPHIRHVSRTSLSRKDPDTRHDVIRHCGCRGLLTWARLLQQWYNPEADEGSHSLITKGVDTPLSLLSPPFMLVLA